MQNLARFSTLVVAGALAAGFTVGCSDFTGTGERGTLTVLLTDAAGDMLDSATIYVSEVYVIGGNGTSGPRYTISDTAAVYNLLDFQGGVTTLLGSADIPVGDYHQLRLVVDSARAVLKPVYSFADGSSAASLTVPSGGTSGLKVNFAGPVHVSPGETVLVVDFDVERSFVFQGSVGNPISVSFKPVIHAVAMDMAGSISGTITPNDSQAQVFAIVGVDTVGSAMADPQSGEYTMHFVPPATYTVAASAAGFQPSEVTGIVVADGEDVTGVDLTLSP